MSTGRSIREVANIEINEIRTACTFLRAKLYKHGFPADTRYISVMETKLVATVRHIGDVKAKELRNGSTSNGER